MLVYPDLSHESTRGCGGDVIRIMNLDYDTNSMRIPLIQREIYEFMDNTKMVKTAGVLVCG